MSNRKESMQKSLRLTVYPWSSDDEEDGNECSLHSVQTQLTESHSQPNLSTVPSTNNSSQPQPSTSGTNHSRRSQAKRENAAFWLSLNNPYRYSPSSAGVSRSRLQELRSQDTSAPRSSSSLIPPTSLLSSTEQATNALNRLRHVIAIKDLKAQINKSRSYSHGHSSSALPPSRSGVWGPGLAELTLLGETPPCDPPTHNVINLDQEPEDVETSVDIPNNSGEADPECVADPRPETEAPPTDDATNDDNVLVTEAESEKESRGLKRKRDEREPSLGPASLETLNASLLALLECPVCLEWMEPPIAQCRRGHLVCSRCRARIAQCPVCRTAFSSVRNRAMEGVAGVVRYPCRHGCGREVSLRARGSHEASCVARTYPCPAPRCHARRMLHGELAAHAQSEHSSLVRTGRKHQLSLKVNAEQHDHWLLVDDGRLFHARVDVDIRSWAVVVYVAYIGPKCQAKDFSYQVSIEGVHNARSVVYTRGVHSDLESYMLNVSRQDCFHVSLDQALNFLRPKNKYTNISSQQDKTLDFTIEISQRDSERKESSSES